MDFEALENISSQVDGINKKVFERFDAAYHEALALVASLNALRAEDPFAALPLVDLKAASQALIQAIKTKPSIPHPYALLSYLFFLMHDVDRAVKYLSKADALAPGWPKIQELRLCYLHYIETLESAQTASMSTDSQAGTASSHQPTAVKSLSLSDLSASQAEPEKPVQETTENEEDFLILDF